MAAEDGAAEAPEAQAATADATEMEEDEGERAADGEGLGNALPVARVKRIMRKNPDKKKNFSKDTVLAVSMATVASLRLRPRAGRCTAVQQGMPRPRARVRDA